MSRLSGEYLACALFMHCSVKEPQLVSHGRRSVWKFDRLGALRKCRQPPAVQSTRAPSGSEHEGRQVIEYVQAQFAAINEHRISFGVGIQDVLPNVNFDLFAGGMFEESQDFGPFTSASVESYWIGGGLTWHSGGCCDCGDCDACCQ